MNKRTYNALRKVAADYTPHQWRKYTTERERKAIQAIENKLANSIMPYLFSPAGILTAVPGFVLGSAAGGLTPSWDLEDLEETAADPDFKTKAKWIPGYLNYKNVKAIGAVLRIKNKVKEAVEAEKKEKDKDKS